MTTKDNPTKRRFLQELYKWLDDGTLYYAFSGELVHWKHANTDYKRELLKEAFAAWPERLQRIQQARLSK